MAGVHLVLRDSARAAKQGAAVVGAGPGGGSQGDRDEKEQVRWWT